MTTPIRLGHYLLPLRSSPHQGPHLSMDQSSDLTNNLSDNPVIVRRSELLNLIVMDRDSMQEVGRVERLWMYPQAHRVLGVICKSGGLFGKQRWAYKLPQITSVSSGNIWISGAGTTTESEQVRQLQSLIDHEVWVDGGDRLGLIADCLFNRKTGQITQYLFVNNRLRQLVDAPLPLPPSEILSFGNQRALVRPDAINRLRRERPNLRETLTQLKDEARAEYDQVTIQAGERFRNWGEDAKTAKERLAEQADQLRQQAAERAKALGEQVVEQSQELGQQWEEQRESLADDWSERRVGERSPELGQQFTEQVQGLSQQASRRYRRLQRQAEGFIEDLPPLEELRGRSGSGEGRDWRDGDRRSTRYDDAEISTETTWVDEAGALPPASPPMQQASASQRAPQSGQPHQSGQSAARPGQQHERQAESPEQFVSRDNPWGYADSATESDWGDLEEPIAPQFIPSGDLDDDDPWV